MDGNSWSLFYKLFLTSLPHWKRWAKYLSISNAVLQLIEHKHILWIIDWYIYCKSETEENYRLYWNCNKNVFLRQESHHNFTVSSGNKPFYAHLHKCLSIKVSIPPVVYDQEVTNLITDSLRIANVAKLNEFQRTYSKESNIHHTISIQLATSVNK